MYFIVLNHVYYQFGQSYSVFLNGFCYVVIQCCDCRLVYLCIGQCLSLLICCLVVLTICVVIVLFMCFQLTSWYSLIVFVGLGCSVPGCLNVAVIMLWSDPRSSYPELHEFLCHFCGRRT